jgi:ribosomal protein uL22
MKEKLENQAVANTTMPISSKDSVNIGKLIKGRKVDQAIMLLEKIIAKEMALPIVRFSFNVSHKRGLGIGGRYPQKSSKGIIKALKLLKANAKAKGLDESKLIINEFISNYAISNEKRGRYKTGALTHIKIGAVVKE